MQDVIRTKVGIYSTEEKPAIKDINAIDGILMYGYRKVRVKNGYGYIHAHKAKFGCKELADHGGRWVLVDVSDYWAVTARVGAELLKQDAIHYTGVRCPFLRDDNENQKS